MKTPCCHCKRLISPRGMGSHLKHCPVLKAADPDMSESKSSWILSYLTKFVSVLCHEPIKFIWWMILLFGVTTVISKSISWGFMFSLFQGRDHAFSPLVRWIGGEMAQGEQDLLQSIKGGNGLFSNGT
jgi:hypothetical protein